MNCNFYKRQLDTAYKAMMDAWDAAVDAVKEAKHFVAISSVDGFPAWRKCFFGETGAAYEKAFAEYERVRALYDSKEDELKATTKREKLEWEAAHPEEAAEKKRKAKLARYKRLAEQKEAAIARLECELQEIEQKMRELEG